MASLLPWVPVYHAAAVRAADLAAQRDHGLPGRELMRAAAAAALADLQACWPRARRLAVVCGAGNNGGDGYDLATLALAAGLQPVLVAFGAPARLQGDALAACREWQHAGGAISPPEDLPAALAATDLVVDGLFGTGLSRPLEGVWAEAVATINAAGRPVLALDLPSGMNADTGVVHGVAVRADVTSTFVGWKAGLFLNPAQAGRVRLHTLGVPAAAFGPAERPLLWQLPALALAQLPRRARDAHKGRHGHVVVVGGAAGMPGAVRLAGEAALRSGAGRVSVLTHPDHAPSLVVGCPELMAHAAGAGEALVQQLSTADVVVCGPGLGRGEWGAALLAAVLQSAANRPVVLDADALMLLAAKPRLLSANFILTPHPGEAAALLGSSVAAVQADRAAAIRALVARFGATVVLKGAATLTLGPSGLVPVACELGNPGMGTAGMGDVLAGVCGALAAQDICDPAWGWSEAAPAGDEARVEDGHGRNIVAGWTAVAALAVVAHAAAGDLAAARDGERGLVASDLLPLLRRVLNGMELPP